MGSGKRAVDPCEKYQPAAATVAAALALALPRMYAAAIHRCAFVIQRIQKLELMPRRESDRERELQHSVQCRVAAQKSLLLSPAEAYHFECLVDWAPSPANPWSTQNSCRCWIKFKKKHFHWPQMRGVDLTAATFFWRSGAFRGTR